MEKEREKDFFWKVHGKGADTNRGKGVRKDKGKEMDRELEMERDVKKEKEVGRGGVVGGGFPRTRGKEMRCDEKRSKGCKRLDACSL